ncbi:hypothetical protein GJ496_009809 [Pomphorhynchus laevis]|nr:hypothetical protein GJ496_009809 [Pomphorhynchus laevis]
MYWRWELPDGKLPTNVQGANNQKMYPDYAFAVEDGNNLKRKVKIGAITIVTLLILAGIAAVPAVLLTLPRYRVISNVTNNNRAMPSNASDDLHVRDNLADISTAAIVSNRTVRQIISQNANIQAEVKNKIPIEDTNLRGNDLGSKISHADNKHDSKLNGSEESDEYDITEGIEATNMIHEEGEGNYDDYIHELIKQNTELSNTLKSIAVASIPIIDNNMSETDYDGIGINVTNASKISNAKVLIVFQRVSDTTTDFRVKDFGNVFLPFIIRNNQNLWHFISHDTHDGHPSDSEMHVSPNLAERITNTISSENDNSDLETEQIDQMALQAKEKISCFISKTVPICWILVVKKNETNYQHIASGPVKMSTAELLQINLRKSINVEDLDQILSTIVQRIHNFVA